MPGAEVLAAIPDWVVPTHEDVIDILRAASEGSAGGGHAAGYRRAVYWATDIVWSTPMSCQGSERPVTWTEARAECWMAACAAAQAPPPSEQEWQLLGARARDTAAADPDYAHGAWHVLAWLLGERSDPPRPASTPDPQTPNVEFLELERLAQQRAEARQRCADVRQRITAAQ